MSHALYMRRIRLPSHQTCGDSNSRQFDLHASACFPSPKVPKFYFLNEDSLLLPGADWWCYRTGYLTLFLRVGASYLKTVTLARIITLRG